MYRSRFKEGRAAIELASERAKWVESLDDGLLTIATQNHALAQKIKHDFDRWAISNGPPMSVKGDILAHVQAKYRQKHLDGYSARSKRNRNDGIDFLLNFAFMWPSLLCTRDERLVNLLRELPSYQSRWTYTPEFLEEKWKSKQITEPAWFCQRTT